MEKFKLLLIRDQYLYNTREMHHKGYKKELNH